MVKIVVIGGGMAGLMAGMVLADDGHAVQILERDPALPPDPVRAWDEWDRASIRQFRLPHFLLPPVRQALVADLPRVAAALEAAGGLQVDPIASMPAELSGGRRPDDDRFVSLTGSRPMVEAVVARCAADTDRLEVRRGVTVAGLLVDDGRDPLHVVGVETVEGERFGADLVIDASGRASALPRLLAAAGARSPVDEAEQSGFVYYARAFRSPDGKLPVSLGAGLQHYGTISTLTLGADNDTWALALIASGRDRAMRRVRDVAVFDRVWRAHPLVAHWIDGEATSEGVVPLGNIEDRIRHLVVEGRPVATGMLPVGDSWACTNPSVGRGISLAALQVIGLRDLLRTHGADADPGSLATAWHHWLNEHVEAFYRETVAGDRFRLHQIEAALDSTAGAVDGEGDEMVTTLDVLGRVAFSDPELLRIWLDAFLMNRTASELLAEDGLRDRIVGLSDGAERAPGPTRSELEALLA